MELRIWVKTFFSIYRWLERITKTIDDYVDLRAKMCFYKNLSCITMCGTHKAVNDITMLMNKKISLINIKCLVEKILHSLPEKSARFLILKYVEDKTFAEVAQVMKISERTALRWNTATLKSGAKILQTLGYTSSKILILIENQRWLLNMARQFGLEEKVKHSKKLSFFVVLHDVQKELKQHMI